MPNVPRSYPMNEKSQGVNTLISPIVPQEHGPLNGPRSGLLTGLGRVLPSMLVLAALAGIAYGGHRTGWTMPKFSALIRAPQGEKADWCGEHGILESECVECNPALLPKENEFGWCKEHGVPECLLEHPELAQLKDKPQISSGDLDRSQR